MAGGVTLQVRQIGSYPLVGDAGPGDNLLIQPGGLGNPYASISATQLVATALIDAGVLGLGTTPPANAAPGQVFASTALVQPMAASTLLWNSYWGTDNQFHYVNGGLAGLISFSPAGYAISNTPVGTPGQGFTPSEVIDLAIITTAGMMALPLGTLEVARDPAAANEVATAGWVGANTVASFNGRKGAVTLNGCDVYSALCLDSTIATENWVNANIQASIQMLLANHPFVFGWNGRTGAVYLTLADISCVFFQPGQQPITQTPPLTSNDYSIPNTAWVVEYIANEFAGGGTTLATQAWVLANTVNSFNGRQGVVTLTSSDVFDVGAAPLNSPAFSGIPTAPTAAIGQATGQIATTAFVQQAISHNTAGVSTFNTRTGDVVLENADIVAAGGLANPSANLTGAPSCPTAAPGTSTPQIANTQFVMAAIAAGTVQSFNTRTGAVTLTLADVTGVGGAPLVSPAFSSVPTAPTAAPGTNTVQLATCAFVQAALTAAGGVSSFNSRTGAVTLTANDVSAVGALVNPSVGLTGLPTSTTPLAGDNSTRIATTAFVTQALSSGAVTSFNTRTGAVTLQGADITAAGGALLASPAFTGAPTAPTAAPATNNTQIATTAYVTAAILADTTGVTSFNTRTGAITLLTADITGAGGAPIASPSFSGVPLAPTATAGTSTTQIATTAFVQNAIASSGVSSFNARTGAVTLIANDISAAGGALLASPIFTGTPTAPTAAPGTNTTQLATTAFVAGYLPLAGGQMTGSLGVGQAVPTSPAPLLAGVFAGGTLATQTGLGLNSYQSSPTTWNYVVTGLAARIALSSAGNLLLAAAPSGTAGSAAAFPTPVAIDPAGDVTLPGSVATPADTSYGTLSALIHTGAAANTNYAFNGYVSATGGPVWRALQAGYAGYMSMNSGGVWSATLFPSLAAGAVFPANVAQISLDQTGLFAVSGAIHGNGSRIISVGNANNPAVSALDSSGATFDSGFWSSTAGPRLNFGQMNSSGVPTTLFGAFDPSGNLVIQGTLTQGSDATGKTGMTPIAEGVSLIKQLIPKSFAWNSSPDKTQWGFIAQDVQPVIPPAVSEVASGLDGSTSLSLDTTAILAAAVNALKQALSRIEALEAVAGITPPAEAVA